MPPRFRAFLPTLADKEKNLESEIETYTAIAAAVGMPYR